MTAVKAFNERVPDRDPDFRLICGSINAIGIFTVKTSLVLREILLYICRKTFNLYKLSTKTFLFMNVFYENFLI